MPSSAPCLASQQGKSRREQAYKVHAPSLLLCCRFLSCCPVIPPPPKKGLSTGLDPGEVRCHVQLRDFSPLKDHPSSVKSVPGFPTYLNILATVLQAPPPPFSLVIGLQLCLSLDPCRPQAQVFRSYVPCLKLLSFFPSCFL